MAYRYGDRYQRSLFPQSIDDYVPADSPVRAYDAFLDSLDFDELGIEINTGKVGCPQYDPVSMLKLLLYGYSYGVRSSRKLEREANYNISFIWLTGGLKPDHKTIAEFRRKNRGALKKVLRQCARLCIKLDLIKGNTLFIDGTKVRANASNKNTWTKEKCQRRLKSIDKRIKQILSECETVDRKEVNQGSWIKMDEELSDQKKLRSKVESIMEQIQAEDSKSTNMTDPDCKMMHSIQGSHSSYNVQSAVDDENGLIVNSDVVSDNHDYKQFADQVDKANDTLDNDCETACADAGYSSVDELEKIDEKGIEVVVPSKKQAEKKKKDDNPFDRSKFEYDKKNDCFICPEGHVLKYSYTNKTKKAKVYRGGAACRKCRHFGKCTDQQRGRSVSRLLNADVQEKLEARYEQPRAQEVYKRRKQKVELPFGHIKRNLKVDSFLLRGLEGVRAEASLLASCFNVARMMSLLGVEGLISTLAK
ncbi:Transposase DDE domain protein [Anaerohalosphaera lusitana]|uniref:Transposase DDE domain protein n=1 Tax=Anaerohalosphaera lusitana TaxID=1936003 RepID=A0A1U9NN02_9BACT|nr:IS1182 family transposase [Anaerohalosphaera lusitana]AQT68886.1 Transposase DDE domain protein [Anaerohalosphaera lusitana]